MKYLSNHDNTAMLLNTWAGSKQAIRASFFFWSSGLALQKTQRGLMQSRSGLAGWGFSIEQFGISWSTCIGLPCNNGYRLTSVALARSAG